MVTQSGSQLGALTVGHPRRPHGIRVGKLAGCGGGCQQLSYYHEDHLGSTRLVTSASVPANQLFSTNYKPFGIAYNSVGTDRYKYTGELQDANTGLYRFGARYYDPAVGRFLTQDPLLEGGPGAQGLNRYAYTENNPMNRVDPSRVGGCSRMALKPRMEGPRPETENPGSRPTMLRHLCIHWSFYQS